MKRIFHDFVKQIHSKIQEIFCKLIIFFNEQVDIVQKMLQKCADPEPPAEDHYFLFFFSSKL